MHAKKITTTTDESGNLKNLPKLRPKQQVELILLFPEQEDLPQSSKREPPEELKGLIVEKGDIFSSASEGDWGIL